MFRKSLLLFSFASIAALIAWGFAPGGSTPACASTTSTKPDCTIKLTVDSPSMAGTAASPGNVSAHFQVTNVPPCYRITGAEVTFTVTRNNAPTIRRTVNVSPLAVNASTGAVSGTASTSLGLGQNLPLGEQPNAIVAEVKVTAEADPRKQRTESNTKSL